VRLNASLAITLSAVLLVGATSLTADTDLRLVEAVKRQDRTAIQALLKQGVDINAPQGDGATALHWSVYVDDLVTTDLLIRARANVNSANDLGVTPLFLACSNANAAIVEKLLAAGANPNTQVTTTGVTALMAAARSGSAETVKALLFRGANVNAAETAHGQTALMWAAANAHPKVVRVLIEGGANVTARSRVDHMLVMVGDHVTDFDAGGSSALLFAARQGDIETAKLLLAAGANVNDATPDNTSVLVFAAHSNQGAFAAYLLDQGADPNANASGYTALHAAVLRGDLALVKALLAHHADPNARLVRGTPVNRDSKDYVLNPAWIGATPFWLAAKFGEADILHALAAGGADPRLTTPDGMTPLMVAAGLGHSGREVADRRGRRLDPTEIAAAAESGEEERETLEAVKAAIELGADVNAVNAAGDTAIHGAVIGKQRSVVQWLVDHGASVDVKNKRGQTPLSIASRPSRGQADEGGVDTRMVELLRRLGAMQ
jgi:ankyrin